MSGYKILNLQIQYRLSFIQKPSGSAKQGKTRTLGLDFNLQDVTLIANK